MDEMLERCIRNAYPDGRLEYVSREACDFSRIAAAEEHLQASLKAVGAELGDLHHFASLERVVRGSITLCSESAGFWRSMNGEQQRQYLLQHDTPWVQLNIHLSTVYPAFELFFSLFNPASEEQCRQGKGWFDIACPRQLETAPWPAVVAAVRQACHAAGYSELPDDVLHAEVPFITEAEWPAGDDDADMEREDYEDTLPCSVCNVAQCLFQAW